MSFISSVELFWNFFGTFVELSWICVGTFLELFWNFFGTIFGDLRSPELQQGPKIVPKKVPKKFQKSSQNSSENMPTQSEHCWDSSEPCQDKSMLVGVRFLDMPSTPAVLAEHSRLLGPGRANYRLNLHGVKEIARWEGSDLGLPPESDNTQNPHF